MSFIDDTTANLCVALAPAAATGGTITLPAAGAGLFHYICAIYVGSAASASAGVAGANIFVTTTNLPGTPAWPMPTTHAAGQVLTAVDVQYPIPVKSSVANTNTTVVVPAPPTNVTARAHVWYYVGP